MSEEAIFTDMVAQAQSGQSDSLESLSKTAQRRLCAYIYRITLNRAHLEDLVQETLLEMVKSLPTLRDTSRFWPWLYRIAWSKIQRHYGFKRRKPAVQASTLDDDYLSERLPDPEKDGLQVMMQKELSQKVMSAVAELKQQQRAVLTLRCFEQMPYSQIAVVLECSELNARIYFHRAKQSLKKLLTRKGLGKGSLLSCLALFGNLTEPAEAARGAVGSVVTSGTLSGAGGGGGGATMEIAGALTKVGMVAAVIGTLSSKAGVAILVTALSLGTVGGVSVLSGGGLPHRDEVESIHFTVQSRNSAKGAQASLSKGAYEQWYYFPAGIDGAMYKRMQRWDPKQEKKLCTWLENAQGNYYYHSGKKKIYISNYHLFRSTLNVRRFPSDTPELTAFLDSIEGEFSGVEYQRDSRTGLLIDRIDDRFVDARHFLTLYDYNTLTSEDFDYEKWRESFVVQEIVDERDVMHRRGWTYFMIQGSLDGQTIQGRGRIPLNYAAYPEHLPWLTLKVEGHQQIIDTPDGAYIRLANGEVLSYPAGSFFKGLARPWMGYHTVDTVRRDAAEQQIRFETGEPQDWKRVAVTLLGTSHSSSIQLIYTINLDVDVIDDIQFGGERKGKLTFTYLQELEENGADFTEPTLPTSPQRQPTRQEEPGVQWLFDLAGGTLGP